MRIGIDASPLTEELTGVGTYLYFILEELLILRPEDQFFLYSRKWAPALRDLTLFPNVTIRLNSFLGKSMALWSQTTLAVLSYYDHLDFFWGVTQSLPLLTRKGQKNLITIHDFAYKLYPSTVSRVRGAYLRLLGKKMMQKADLIVANSQGTKERCYTLYQKKVDGVIPPPLKKGLGPKSSEEIAPLLSKHGLTYKGYVLMVGTLEPRKNFSFVLNMYASLLKQHPQDSFYPLVIVGKKGWREKKILPLLNASGVRFLGYQPQRELHALIAGARYCCMPSLYEGYGMPLAEARVCGTEVLCTDVPEMREAAENEAAILTSEGDFLRHFVRHRHEPKQIRCQYATNRDLATRLSEFIG